MMIGSAAPTRFRVAESAAVWRRTAGMMLLVVALLFAAACDSHLPTYRYRLTVEVDTPEGLKSGSSVIEVRTSQGAGFPGPEAGRTYTRVFGEAVAVDLGARGTLFALLRTADESFGGPPGGWAWVLLPPQGRNSGHAWEERVERYRALANAKGQAALPVAQYPLLVRFRDMADPQTLERIQPAAVQEKFGDGVQVRRISVEITRDRVTRTIADKLPWLDRLEDYRTDRDNPFTSTLPDEITSLTQDS